MTRERFVRSFDDTELYVRETGEGLPIVLCDGIGCDGFIWKYLSQHFGERYRLVRWHYRGHGQSAVPKDPGSLTMEALRQDLEVVVRALELPPFVLVGHSM